MVNLDKIINKDLYNNIIRKLYQNFGVLPAEGVIAGQAVASTIYELIGLTRNAPYNDLDVFCENNEMTEIIESRSGYPLSKIGGTNGVKMNSYSSSMSGMTLANRDGHGGYSISSTVYLNGNERINVIHYRLEAQNFKLKRAMSLITAFDINACQVAIDLKTKEVIWTNEFQNFLFQKELKTSYFGTPMHTAVRLLKKEREIDFSSLDKDQQMRKLQTVRQVVKILEEKKVEGKQFFPGNLMSEIYLKRFDNERDTIYKYFTSYEKICRFDNNQEFVNNEMIETYNEKTMFVINPNDYCGDTVKLFFDLIYNESSKEIIDTMIPYFERVYEISNEKNKKNTSLLKYVELIRKTEKDSDVVSMMIRNALMDKDFKFSSYKEAYLKRFMKFYKKHPEISQLYGDLPLDDQFHIANVGTWLEKNTMRYVVGALQGFRNDEKVLKARITEKKQDLIDYYKGAYTLEELKSPDFKKMVSIAHEEKMEKIKKQNVEPLWNKELIESLIKENDDIHSIKEITNNYDLFMEGENMRHCVGGYWGEIISGSSAIFHIECINDGKIEYATAQISLLSKNSKEIVNACYQLYGQGNQNVSEIMNQVSKKLIQALDDSLIDKADLINYVSYENEQNFKLDDFNKMSKLEKLLALNCTHYFMNNPEDKIVTEKEKLFRMKKKNLNADIGMDIDNIPF